eukprot:CFRG2698T1
MQLQLKRKVRANSNQLEFKTDKHCKMLDSHGSSPWTSEWIDVNKVKALQGGVRRGSTDSWEEMSLSMPMCDEGDSTEVILPVMSTVLTSDSDCDEGLWVNHPHDLLEHEIIDAKEEKGKSTATRHDNEAVWTWSEIDCLLRRDEKQQMKTEDMEEVKQAFLFNTANGEGFDGQTQHKLGEAGRTISSEDVDTYGGQVVFLGDGVDCVEWSDDETNTLDEALVGLHVGTEAELHCITKCLTKSQEKQNSTILLGDDDDGTTYSARNENCRTDDQGCYSSSTSPSIDIHYNEYSRLPHITECSCQLEFLQEDTTTSFYHSSGIHGDMMWNSPSISPIQNQQMKHNDVQPNNIHEDIIRFKRIVDLGCPEVPSVSRDWPAAFDIHRGVPQNTSDTGDVLANRTEKVTSNLRPLMNLGYDGMPNNDTVKQDDVDRFLRDRHYNITYLSNEHTVEYSSVIGSTLSTTVTVARNDNGGDCTHISPSIDENASVEIDVTFICSLNDLSLLGCKENDIQFAAFKILNLSSIRWDLFGLWPPHNLRSRASTNRRLSHTDYECGVFPYSGIPTLYISFKFECNGSNRVGAAALVVQLKIERSEAFYHNDAEHGILFPTVHDDEDHDNTWEHIEIDGVAKSLTFSSEATDRTCSLKTASACTEQWTIARRLTVRCLARHEWKISLLSSPGLEDPYSVARQIFKLYGETFESIIQASTDRKGKDACLKMLHCNEDDAKDSISTRFWELAMLKEMSLLNRQPSHAML